MICVKRKYAFEHALNAQIQINLSQAQSLFRNSHTTRWSVPASVATDDRL